MKHFFFAIFLLVCSTSFGQKQRLVVGGFVPKLYFIHQVEPKETFSTIAAKYNLPPDSLSEFNDMDYFEGELRAKNLKIPLVESNFTQEGIAGNSEALIPVYQLVTYNQSIEQVSSKAYRIPVAALRKWNELPEPIVEKGKHVIVGFYKVKENFLAYFEDSVSRDFAKFEKPVPQIVVKAKADSIALAPKTGKKVQPVIETPKATARIDSTTLAVNTGKKVNNNKPVANTSKVTDSLATNIAKNTEPQKAGTRPPNKLDTKTNTAGRDTTSVAINADKKAIDKKNTDRSNANTKVDSVSVAKVDNKLAPKKTGTKPKTNNKVDTASIAAPTLKSTGTKKNVRNPKIDTKVDTISLATNTVAKADTRPKTNSKVDTTSLVATAPKNTNTNKNVGKLKTDTKVDSISLAANTTKKSETGKTDIKANNNNKVYPTSIVTGTPITSEAGKNTDELKTDTKVNPSAASAAAKTNEAGPANTNTATTLEITTPLETTVAKAGNETKTVEAAEKNIVSNAVLDLSGFQSIFSAETESKPEKQLTGEASYFQSKSGWNDRKFYVLMPGVAVGTIVKITSMDSRSVYAKVLGTMPQMKENDGVVLRLSDAAVAALGVKKDKFPVVVTYY